jgi:hypothetical protein
MAEAKFAAYVSWVTFKNSLDRLGQSMPNRVDKTVFPGMAGGTLVQLLPALKFLGLIREDGTPTEALRSLVKKGELDRKEELHQVFSAAYKDLFTLDLTSATPSQLHEKMNEYYGVTGSTLKKAVRFFLSGAAEIGIPLSNYLVTAKGTANGAGSIRRRIVRKQKSAPVAQAPLGIPASSGTSKSIRMKRGETVTLSATADFFAMEADDRDFLFGIVKQLEEYERKLDAIPSGQSQTDGEGEE